MSSRGISIRLDERKREKLINILLAHRYYDEVMELVKARKNFALVLYNDGLGPKRRKIIASLPDGWLPKVFHIQAAIPAGGMIKIDFDGTFDHCHYPDWLEKIINFKGRPDRIEFSLPDEIKNLPLKSYDRIDDPIVVKWEELQRAEEKLRERVDKAAELARTYIWKAGSTGALKQMWPEMTEFCAQLEGVVGNQLPAIPTQELNMVFKLPPDKKKKAA